MKQEKTPLEEALEYLREVRYYDIVDFQYKSAISEAIKIAISSAEKPLQEKINQLCDNLTAMEVNKDAYKKECKELKDKEIERVKELREGLMDGNPY